MFVDWKKNKNLKHRLIVVNKTGFLHVFDSSKKNCKNVRCSSAVFGPDLKMF